MHSASGSWTWGSALKASLRQSVLVMAPVIVAAAVVVAVVLSMTGRGDDSPNPSPTPDPETDASGLPGTFVPTQGRGHFNRTYRPDLTPTPFCAGVATSAQPGSSTAAAPTTQSGKPNSCYASNPPTSGWHLGNQRNVEVAPGARINIPPDPDVYPSDIEIPREAIPHILEHAGVFVGYNCDGSDPACEEVVEEEVARIVNDRIDNHNDRVVMARDSDLPLNTLGLASWTRVDTFAYAEFTEDRVVSFIDVHSCRFDPEGFCR